VGGICKATILSLYGSSHLKAKSKAKKAVFQILLAKLLQAI
jgi:hypothetical protein